MSVSGPNPNKLGGGLGNRPRAPHYEAPRVGILPEEEVGVEEARVQQMLAARKDNSQRIAESVCNSCQWSVIYRTTPNSLPMVLCELTTKQMTPIVECSRHESRPRR